MKKDRARDNVAVCKAFCQCRPSPRPFPKEMEKKLERLSKTHSDAASRVYYRGLSIFLTRSLNKGSVSSLLTQ